MPVTAGAGGGAQADDPAYTRRRVKEFLAAHTAYELIPESGKVVLLDAALPIRQAFHALHEQVRGNPLPVPNYLSLAQMPSPTHSLVGL